MLKLSEAISLGRILVRVPRAHRVSSCAVGMALRAYNKNHRFGDDEADYEELVAMYPWLATHRNCPWCKMRISRAAVIFHPFDTHVMGSNATKPKRITFDQMIDWIRSIEPPTAETVAEATQNETEEFVTVT